MGVGIVRRNLSLIYSIDAEFLFIKTREKKIKFSGTKEEDPNTRE